MGSDPDYAFQMGLGSQEVTMTDRLVESDNQTAWQLPVPCLACHPARWNSLRDSRRVCQIIVPCTARERATDPELP